MECLLAAVVWAAPPKPAPAPAGRTIKAALWVDSEQDLPLTAKDLTARIEGHDTRVVDVKGPADSLMIILVLDLAGDLSLAEPAKEAVATEIEKLPPHDFLAVMRAQDGPHVLADPGEDRAPAVAAVRDLTVSGKAGFLDTVETVAHVADSILSKADIRIAVLYVTDSDVENYREDFTNPVINSSDTHDLSRKFPEALVQEKISKIAGVLAAGQAPLFVVHLRYRSDRLGEAYQSGLKQLAEVTGGSAIFCRSSEEIADAIHRAVARIESSYMVTLTLPPRATRTFQVQLDGGGKWNVSYRTRFTVKER